MSPKLSIVVPCYNEAKNIPLVLERFKEALDGHDVELILVNNNSKDDTEEVLKKLLPKYPFARTIFEPVAGYGSAAGRGLKEAKGEYLCCTHADLQTDPADTIKAYKIAIKQRIPKRTFVKGNRKGRPFIDTFFAAGMSLFETIILKTKLSDINAQPNLFHRNFLNKLGELPKDWSFDVYLYYLAKKNGKVIRFPVRFPERIHGESTWNTGLKNKWKFIKRTINFTINLKKKINENQPFQTTEFEKIIEIVKEAGMFAKEHHGKVIQKSKSSVKGGDKNFQEEKDAFSFVDNECQKIIMKRIIKHYPRKFGLIAEEQDEEINLLSKKFTHRNELIENKYTILIDPIDGTKNYCSATPINQNYEEKNKRHNYWGVSLAIAKGKEIIAGVIYYPTITKTGIILKTQKNQGTWINDKKITLDNFDSFTPDKPIRISALLNNPRFKTSFSNIERYGSFVVTFLALLKGGLKNPPEELKELPLIFAYMGNGTSPLDIGCCSLALKEAGGVVCNAKSEEINIFEYALFDKKFSINTKFIMTLDKSYAQSITNYCTRHFSKNQV